VAKNAMAITGLYRRQRKEFEQEPGLSATGCEQKFLVMRLIKHLIQEVCIA
jgi:hypothetical protein